MREITGAEQAVAHLLNPASVAVIGASARPGSLSWWPIHLMRHRGFAGALFPVNPKYGDIDGLTCYPSVGDLPQVPEVAIVTLNADATLHAVEECASAGVAAVVLPSQGFGELGEEGRGRERRLLEAVRVSGMRIVGPNTDGVANLATGAVVSIQPLFEQDLQAGSVGVVAQSGATAASLIVRLQAEGVGVRMSASAGNEIDLGLADYLSVMLQDPDIRMVVSFVEAIRDPRAFYRVAELAAELDKPIALLKVGRSEEGARRASAHTGAMAGSDRLNDAVFAKYGVMRMSELSEIVSVAKTFLGAGTPRTAGVGIISPSGGQAGAAADKAALEGVPVPALGPASEKAIDSLLAFGTGFNPCDLTGEIAVKPELAGQVFRQFAADAAIGTVVYVRKKLLGDVSERCAGPLVEASREMGVPVLVYAMDGIVTGEEASIYEAAGIPVFTSLGELYRSVSALSRRKEALHALARPGSAARAVPASDGIVGSGSLQQEAARGLLSHYGVPVPAEAIVSSEREASDAADRIGYPVVLKLADDRIAHKTEVGGVVLGLRTAEEVADAARTLIGRARDVLDGAPPQGLLVQEQVQEGIEMIAGLAVDPELGAFVLVGMGGVTAELIQDTAIRPAPVSPADAAEMIASLRHARILDGFRGAPKADVAALADLVSRLSWLGADHPTELVEADLNPVMVLPDGQGVRVVDSLFVLADR